MKWISKCGGALLRAFLKPGWLRRRVAFTMRQRHYEEVEVAVPLGQGLKCPIYTEEAWASFEHIFVDGEYRAAFEKIPLPSRWIDLGCYAGYFSLYTVLMRAKAGLNGAFDALLIDADARSQPAIAKLAELNGLAAQVRFRQGLIAGGRARLALCRGRS